MPQNPPPVKPAVSLTDRETPAREAAILATHAGANPACA